MFRFREGLIKSQQCTTIFQMFLVLDSPLESEELTFTCNTEVANTTDEALVIASDPYCEVPQTESGGNSKYNFKRRSNLTNLTQVDMK